MPSIKKLFLKVSVIIFLVYQITNIVIVNQSWRSFDNDLSILTHRFSANLVLCFVFVLCCIRFFFARLVCMLRQLHVQYGTVRLGVYIIVLFIFSWVFIVLVLDGTVIRSLDVLKAKTAHRFESNVIDLADSRETLSDHIGIHPLTKGKKTPLFLQKSYRYKGEDAYFLCVGFTTPGKHRGIQVIWMKNGKPLPSSTRFHQEMNITYSSENYDEQSVKSHSCRDLKISGTLKIFLVEPNDFGNYTCHIVHKISVFPAERIHENQDILVSITDSCDKNGGLGEKINRHAKEQTNFEDKLAILKYMHAKEPYHEFMLIEIPRKQRIITVAPGAFLMYKTMYIHLGKSDETVSIEYFINGKSAETKVCEGLFTGCSKFLFLYYYLSHGLVMLTPVAINLDTERFMDRQRIRQYYHCVCSDTYGIHSVRYVRNYYNPRTGRHEILEFRHPDELVVIPREQNMLNFYNDEQPSEPVYPSDTHFKMAATSVTNQFALWENFLLGMVLVVFVLMLKTFIWFVRMAGRSAGRFILDDPTYLWFREVQQREVSDDAWDNFSKQHYDIFISHSHCNLELVIGDIMPLLRNHQQRVCTSEVGIPPNFQIISAVSTAIDNSNRYIIILCEEYLKEMMMINMEVGIISFKAFSSERLSRSSLLIIKLDNCQLLTWMMSFEIHDWTTSLSREDQLLRLSRWVQGGVKRNARTDFCKICLMFLLVVVGVLFVCCVLISLLSVILTIRELRRYIHHSK